MYKILITFAVKTGSKDYPLCVTVDDGQETLVRNIREGRILGNGIAIGIMTCTQRLPQVLLDERLKDIQ